MSERAIAKSYWATDRCHHTNAYIRDNKKRIFIYHSLYIHLDLEWSVQEATYNRHVFPCTKELHEVEKSYLRFQGHWASNLATVMRLRHLLGHW
jgi:hypothetical protein